MLDALRSDLNTPKFFGLVFEHITRVKNDPSFGQAVKDLLQNVIGLTLEPLAEAACVITPEIEKLLAEREQARQAKNWALADQLRDALIAKGYKIQDRKA
jgi:cysteinyl-tRNA synthetase